jgi:hypothetical protein
VELGEFWSSMPLPRRFPPQRGEGAGGLATFIRAKLSGSGVLLLSLLLLFVRLFVLIVCLCVYDAKSLLITTSRKPPSMNCRQKSMANDCHVSNSSRKSKQ